MGHKNHTQGLYQDDDLDMNTDLGETTEEADTWGEKGGQVTRDQSNRIETDDTGTGMLDEDLDVDAGSDF